MAMQNSIKYKQFKKHLLKESIVMAAVALVLGGVVFLLSTISSDYSAENAALKHQVDTINADMNSLKTKYTNIKQDLKLYEEVQKKQSEDRLAINRHAVQDKFNQLKTEFMLGDNLHLVMSPVQVMKDEKYQRKTSMVTYSDVEVSLDALSDEYVYDLLVKMQQELAGVSRITKLSMVKQKPLSDDILRSISVKGSYPLVKTDIKFTCFGINPIETSDIDSNAPKKKP